MAINLLLIFLLNIASLFAEEQPVFKGGQKSLHSFIYNNLIYPEYARENCLQGTIQISFKLNKQGRIYRSEVQKGFGIDLDREALRLVRLTSGKWIMPADHDTLVAMVLPVNFSLKDFKCEERSRDDINAAINAYQARQGLNDAIFNFYDKKAEGSYDPADEARIESLKLQMGYNDKFIDRLLKQAQRKLKQGDKEGACEDFHIIRRLGSDRATVFIDLNCR